MRTRLSHAALLASLLVLALPAAAGADAHAGAARHRHRAPSARQATARAAERCPGADLVPAPGDVARLRAAILCLHNEIRASHGLGRLGENARLRRAAAGHSADMVASGYFEHTTPGGLTMVDRIRRSGYLRPDRGWMVGENLEWGTASLATPRGAMEAWMNSPEHRANILEGGYEEAGVGVTLGTPEDGAEPGATYTVDFGTVG